MPAVTFKPVDLKRASSLRSVEERVTFIEDLMSEVRWRPGTGRLLAKVWKCAPETVRSYGAEAHRRVLSNYRDDSEQVIARMCAAIDHAAQVALTKQRAVTTIDGKLHMVPDPDCRSVIEAQTRLAQILGLLPNKHELMVKYESINDEELISSVVRNTMRSPRLREILLRELRSAEPGLFAIEAQGEPLLEEKNP
jgi:hypothetical protein